MGPQRRRLPAQKCLAQLIFLTSLGRGLDAKPAAATADISLPTLQTWRQQQPEFAAAWRRAIEAGRVARLHAALARPLAAGRMRTGRLALDCPETRRHVLALLSEGGTELYAARRVGLTRTAVWRWRQLDPDFDARWRAAYKAGSIALMDMAQRGAARLRHERRNGR